MLINFGAVCMTMYAVLSMVSSANFINVTKNRSLLEKKTEKINTLKPGATESQKTRNKKQNGLVHSQFIVCVTPKQKNIA